mmetsp:Transcript_7211/g.13090  ORF Transcript_7211/g.13090 Transcript_7211/m.13090 type:complete len:81 (+) Transcript_7211:807-1049(+)
MPQMMSFAGEPEGSSAVSGPTSFGAAWPHTSLSWWMAFGRMPGEKMVNVYPELGVYSLHNRPKGTLHINSTVSVTILSFM